MALLFEGNEGLFYIRNLLGNDLELQSGGLYWREHRTSLGELQIQGLPVIVAYLLIL